MARPAPPCIWREKKIQTPMMTMIGSQLTSSAMNQGVFSDGGARGDLHALLLQLRHEARVERGVGREGAAVGERCR